MDLATSALLWGENTKKYQPSLKDLINITPVCTCINFPGQLNNGLCKSRGFLGGSGGKESAGNARDAGRHKFDPWVGKIPWRREVNPLLYSCLENPMDRGAWRATVHGITKTWT